MIGISPPALTFDLTFMIRSPSGVARGLFRRGEFALAYLTMIGSSAPALTLDLTFIAIPPSVTRGSIEADSLQQIGVNVHNFIARSFFCFEN